MYTDHKSYRENEVYDRVDGHDYGGENYNGQEILHK